MADPLSIAASVVGLAAVTGKITKILWNFVSDVSDAPELAQSTLDTVNQTRLALDGLGHLLDTIASVPAACRAMIPLDHVALTLSSCVLTHSELESLVVIDGGILQRIHWLRAEGRVARLLPRLESQKTSLSLMVTILHCQSHFEAFGDRVRLQSTVDEIRRQNELLSRRMQNIESLQGLGDQSIRFFDDGSTMSGIPMSIDQPSDALSINSSARAGVRESPFRLSSGPSGTWALEKRDFEIVLDSSWVYSRVRGNELDSVSSRSSVARSAAWSMLSGRSLNDLSVISLFRLPVTLGDIATLGGGLTFDTILPNHAAGLGATIPPSSVTPARETNGGVSGPACLPDDDVFTKTSLSEGSLISCVAIGGGNPYLISKVYLDRVKRSRLTHGLHVMPSAGYHVAIRLASGYAYNVRIHKHYDESLRSFAETDVFLLFVVAGDMRGLEDAEKSWYVEVTENCPGIPIILVLISTNSPGPLPLMLADDYDEKLTRLLHRLPLLLSHVICDDVGITEENVDTVLKKVVEDLLKWRKRRRS